MLRRAASGLCCPVSAPRRQRTTTEHKDSAARRRRQHNTGAAHHSTPQRTVLHTGQHNAEDSTAHRTAQRRGQYCTEDSTTQRTALHRGQHNAEDDRDIHIEPTKKNGLSIPFFATPKKRYWGGPVGFGVVRIGFKRVYLDVNLVVESGFRCRLNWG